jgi:hypothetical protein
MYKEISLIILVHKLSDLGKIGKYLEKCNLPEVMVDEVKNFNSYLSIFKNYQKPSHKKLDIC